MSKPTKQWRCTVCGYIHDGESPPDECPVCGAPRDEFEPLEDAAPSQSRTDASKWRCVVCGYIHEGPEPPDECPVCGAGREDFEPFVAKATDKPIPTTKAKLRVVIVGAGVAGVASAEAVRKAAPAAEIVLISSETELPYYRINLTRYLAGEVSEDDLQLHPETWYDERRIQLLRGVRANRLAPEDRQIELSSGEVLEYDRLILAGGADAMLPPISGLDLDGVSALRTVADANDILSAIEPEIPVVIIGGGILGLEAAGGLARRGARVTVLENHEYLMPRQLNERAAAILESHVRSIGITLRPCSKVSAVAGNSGIREVRLEGNESIPANRVIVATGIRPRLDLATRAGILTSNGVVVNDNLLTSWPHVYAAGDLAEHRDTIYGLWGVAQYQGTIAGMNAAGRPTAFGGVPRSTVLKVLGIDLFSIGTFTPANQADRLVEEETDGTYRCFMLREERLAGAILLGNTDLSLDAKKAIESATPLGLSQAKSCTAAQVAERLASMG